MYILKFQDEYSLKLKNKSESGLYNIDPYKNGEPFASNTSRLDWDILYMLFLSNWQDLTTYLIFIFSGNEEKLISY